MKVNWYYKFLIIFLVCFGLFFFLTSNMSNFVNSSMYKNYINFVGVPFNFFHKYNIFKYKDVLKSNERLENELLSFKYKDRSYGDLKEENVKLKKLTGLDKLYTDYDVIYAKTIIRNKMYWYNTITIDKGSSDGIGVGDAVVSAFGLIGNVKSVTRDTAVVKLITSNINVSKISILINKGNVSRHGVISGYDYPYLEIDLTDSASGVSIGDKVLTSGLGNFPKNIEIGEVYDIKKDRYSLLNVLLVKPYQDMSDINYIGVLTK